MKTGCAKTAALIGRTSHRHSLLCFIDSRHRGGAEENLLSLATGLSRRGWTCEVSIPAPGPLAEQSSSGLTGVIAELTTAGITVHRHRHLDDGIPLLGIRGMRILLHCLAYFAARRPAVIHFVLPRVDSSRLPILAAALLRIPFVLSFRLAEDRMIPPFNRKLYRWLASKHSVWLALSSHNRSLLARIFHLPQERLRIVCNGIDVGRFRSVAARREQARKDLLAELGLAQRTTLVVGVGRIEERKGFPYFVAAIPAVVTANPDAVFVWAGEVAGQTRGLQQGLAGGVDGLIRYHQTAESLWLHRPCLRLLGRRTDVAEILAAADVFVLPSLVEGQPRALLEAMAAGLPCVVADASGLAEIITHERDGLLVPPLDCEELAAAINRVLADRTLARNLGSSAAARVKEFDLPIMLERMEEVYGELLR